MFPILTLLSIAAIEMCLHDSGRTEAALAYLKDALGRDFSVLRPHLASIVLFAGLRKVPAAEAVKNSALGLHRALADREEAEVAASGQAW